MEANEDEKQAAQAATAGLVLDATATAELERLHKDAQSLADLVQGCVARISPLREDLRTILLSYHNIYQGTNSLRLSLNSLTKAIKFAANAKTTSK